MGARVYRILAIEGAIRGRGIVITRPRRQRRILTPRYPDADCARAARHALEVEGRCAMVPWTTSASGRRGRHIGGRGRAPVASAPTAARLGYSYIRHLFILLQDNRIHLSDITSRASVRRSFLSLGYWLYIIDLITARGHI